MPDQENKSWIPTDKKRGLVKAADATIDAANTVVDRRGYVAPTNSQIRTENNKIDFTRLDQTMHAVESHVEAQVNKDALAKSEFKNAASDWAPTAPPPQRSHFYGQSRSGYVANNTSAAALIKSQYPPPAVVRVDELTRQYQAISRAAALPTPGSQASQASQASQTSSVRPIRWKNNSSQNPGPSRGK